jgi:hypothetical protein
MHPDPAAVSTAAAMAVTNSAPTATEAAVLPTYATAVTDRLTAFWLPVEEAAKGVAVRPAAALALLGRVGPAAGSQLVLAVGAVLPVRMVAAEVAERRTLAGSVALVAWAPLGPANLGAMGWFTTAATAARRAGAAAIAVTTEEEEAAGAATTAAGVAALAVVLRTMAAPGAEEVEARPMLSRAPRTFASGKGGKIQRITA